MLAISTSNLAIVNIIKIKLLKLYKVTLHSHLFELAGIYRVLLRIRESDLMNSCFCSVIKNNFARWPLKVKLLFDFVFATSNTPKKRCFPLQKHCTCPETIDSSSSFFISDRRIFLGLKFSIPEFFWVGKFGKYFFGWLDLSRDFFWVFKTI